MIAVSQIEGEIISASAVAGRHLSGIETRHNMT
jgi:hypothetical protein